MEMIGTKSVDRHHNDVQGRSGVNPDEFVGADFCPEPQPASSMGKIRENGQQGRLAKSIW